jgi:hypothetical protein
VWWRVPVAYPESDELVEAGTRLAYTIRSSSRRRTLALQVYPDGSVRVAAPIRLPLSRIRDFVRQHFDWIHRKLDELAAHRRVATRALQAGDGLPYLGETLTLRLMTSTGSRAGVRRHGQELRVGVSGRQPPRLLLEDWYRCEATRYAASRVAHYAGLVGRAPQGLVIRGQRTRWGSCSARGTVSLNWRLLQLPPGYLDYVIVHELCHLLQRNHSPRFWREVARVMPDYQLWRRGLRTAAQNFVL